MVTHWESSTRPLFVKTIWRDGQHHVMLQKEEDHITRRSTNSSSHNSARSVRSVKITSSGNKQFSASVKLVLAGVGAFNSKEQKLIRCKSNLKPFDAVPNFASPKETTVAFRNINVINASPECKTNRNFNLCVKSNSIDIHVERENYNKVGTISPYFSYNNRVEACDDSLSDRVMVWLDLAIQNGNYTNEVKIQPQRIVTACHISQKRQHTPIKRKSVHCKFNENCNINRDTFQVEGTSQTIRSVESSVLSHGPSLHEDNAVQKENITTKPTLSSEVEENIEVKYIEQSLPRNQINSVKRQLHIFMPNLPNKFSDCDSSILSSKLSSKLSTSSLQRSMNSKKSKNAYSK